MGLDIVLFDDRNVKIGLFEIPSSLHKALFSNTSNWGSYKYLRKIKDYYRTNVRFNRTELQQFIHDLNHIKLFVDAQHHAMLDILISTLSRDTINSIHIGGD